jgi:excinuclease ABC subunit A
MIANADYIVDMGPGGGEAGGRIVATGTPAQVAANPKSITGRYLARELEG